MQQKAIDKARTRLEWARGHYDKLLAARNFQEFEQSWMQFLVALDGVPIALNICRNDNAKTRQWCGVKSALARKDPLIAYLHQARNEDQHSLEECAEHVPASLGLRGRDGVIHIQSMTYVNGSLLINALPVKGHPPIATVTNQHVRLKDVVDSRYKQTFEVPISHLGRLLRDQSPANIAKLGLAYYEAYIKDAEKLLPLSA